MKAIYNNEFIGDGELRTTVFDRALQYGDGLFETIIIKDGHVDLIEYHFRRLEEGAAVLCFELPDYLSIDYLKTSFRQLQEINQLDGPLRYKVQVWRATGGLYEPESTSSNLLLTVKQYTQGPYLLKHVGISKRIRNHQSIYSRFKTMNALPYIMASLEKKEAGYDDLIILDQSGFVSEFLYSNIFWIANGSFNTPSLSTGCVCGVMRTYLIDHLIRKGISTREVEAYPEELERSDHIFATNAAGIIHVTGFGDQKFEIYRDLEQIIK